MIFINIIETIPWEFLISERWLKWKHCIAFFQQIFASRAQIMINIKAFAGLKIHIRGKRNTRSFPGFQSHYSNIGQQQKTSINKTQPELCLLEVSLFTLSKFEQWIVTS